MSGKRLHTFAAPKGPKAAALVRGAASASREVDEAAARAFVKDEKHESHLRRREPGERIGLYLPTELAQELRRAAVDDRRSVSDAVTVAVREWLERRRAR